MERHEDVTGEIVREYGPFEGTRNIGGVTYDGRRVWFAAGENLRALDPETGAELKTIDVAAHAGTAFDGRYIFQIAEDKIRKIDPETGTVVATIPAPGKGADSGHGLVRGQSLGRPVPRKLHSPDRP